jgi:hypothetical protein
MIRRWLRKLRRRRGTGLIVALVLAAVMGTYMVVNAATLRTLQQRLNVLERRHQARWEQRSARPD